jgi:SAM-dependent methyltransferase
MHSTVWPKRIETLSEELEGKRRLWHQFWLEHYPGQYSFVAKFTEDFLRIAGRVRNPERILEVGPGPTSAIRKLMSVDDTYCCCESNPHFCEILKRELSASQVICADIQTQTPMASSTFDRVVAAHILEHLVNLPAALAEVSRVLRRDGVFDVVIPCEGSPLYALGRRFSSARTFKKRFGNGFYKIMRTEHVNTGSEVIRELRHRFIVECETYFPVNSSRIGPAVNLLAGLRLRKG